jgi:hypothetical protein
MEQGTIIKLNPIIAGLMTQGVTLGANALEQQLEKLKELQAGINAVEQRINQGILALSDADPDDVEQLKEIGRNLVEDLTAILEGFLSTQIGKIENEHVRAFATHFSAPVINLLLITTDDNPDNQAQIVEYFAGFIGGDATQNVFNNHLIGPGLDALAEKIQMPAEG